MTRELTLHNITNITRHPLRYYPAGSVKDVHGEYCCQSIDIQSDDGATFRLNLFADDPAALTPLGVVWNPPTPTPDPEAINFDALPDSEAPTTDRVVVQPELAGTVP